MDWMHEGFLQKLSRFKLLHGVSAASIQQGNRRSKNYGTSMEFADFRAYTPGDDLRQIDWNAFARTNKHYIKRFVNESELEVAIYLDCSKSMSFYSEKWKRARQLAAAFAFLALNQEDRASFIPLSSTTSPLPLRKGKHQLASFLKAIDAVRSAEMSLSSALQAEALKKERRQVRVVISDYFEPLEHCYESLKRLQQKSTTMLLIQILDEEELAPSLSGEYKLTDAETMFEKEVAVQKHVLAQYDERLEAHSEALRNFASSRGIQFIRCSASNSFEQLLGNQLRRAGWIK
ncbi:DUF58 domain-containing protein [Bacillus tianshenii]|nr:DUF58 domain-containing protein [Bacillus tianshenii]